MHFVLTIVILASCQEKCRSLLGFSSLSSAPSPQMDVKVIPDSFADKGENITDPLASVKLNENEDVNQRLHASIQKIHEGLHFIQNQQRIDRNRLNLYSLTNLSSHNNMIMGSIVETLVFIVACLFQVRQLFHHSDSSLQIFFVRRWFLAKGATKDKRVKDAATEWA
jgi:hypothetical protein